MANNRKTPLKDVAQTAGLITGVFFILVTIGILYTLTSPLYHLNDVQEIALLFFGVLYAGTGSAFIAYFGE